MRTRRAVLLIGTFTLTDVAAAQRALVPGDRLRLRTVDSTQETVIGTLRGVRHDTLWLRRDSIGDSLAFARRTLRTVEVRSPQSERGRKVFYGFLAGATAGLMLARASSGDCDAGVCDNRRYGEFGSVGAMTGGLVTAFSTTARWIPISLANALKTDREVTQGDWLRLRLSQSAPSEIIGSLDRAERDTVWLRPHGKGAPISVSRSLVRTVERSNGTTRRAGKVLAGVVVGALAVMAVRKMVDDGCDIILTPAAEFARGSTVGNGCNPDALGYGAAAGIGAVAGGTLTLMFTGPRWRVASIP
jgi:hypothetical protein